MDPETVLETPPVEAVAETPAAPAETPLDGFKAGLAEVVEEPAVVDEPEAEVPADDAEPADEAPPEPEAPDPVEAEVADLKLGERSADRFRELSKSEKVLAPIREAAEKEGVKLEDLPAVFARARERDELMEMVSNTGASPEDFGKLLDYQTAVTAASAGNMKAAEAAFEMLLPEIQALASLLGRDVPGIADPLQAHEDLTAAVEGGDITREHALELARSRNRESLDTGRRTAEDEKVTAQRERSEGVSWLNSFEAQMRNDDPSYDARRPALVAFVETISQTLPPSQWAKAVQNYYSKLPVPAVAAAPPARQPRPGPVRPNLPPSSNMTPETFASPMDAFKHGVSSVS